MYRNPLGKPRVYSFISAFLLSRTRYNRCTHNIRIDTVADNMQIMYDLEYVGPHTDGHIYLWYCGENIVGNTTRFENSRGSNVSKTRHRRDNG